MVVYTILATYKLNERKQYHLVPLDLCEILKELKDESTLKYFENIIFFLSNTYFIKKRAERKVKILNIKSHV